MIPTAYAFRLAPNQVLLTFYIIGKFLLLFMLGPMYGEHHHMTSFLNFMRHCFSLLSRMFGHTFEHALGHRSWGLGKVTLLSNL